MDNKPDTEPSILKNDEARARQIALLSAGEALKNVPKISVDDIFYVAKWILTGEDNVVC